MVEELKDASYIPTHDKKIKRLLEYWCELEFMVDFTDIASKEYVAAWKNEIRAQYKILKEKFDISEETEDITITQAVCTIRKKK